MSSKKVAHSKHEIRVLSMVLCLGMLGGCMSAPPINVESTSNESDRRLARAFDHNETDLQVEGTGTVSRLLADDNEGSRHQRFIIALKTGQTILIVHNIDLAPRIVSLEVGDEIEFFGEYEWNDKGGTIHWTHRDPKGHHVAGWIKHKGRIYQ